jgi:hypothetical protein
MARTAKPSGGTTASGTTKRKPKASAAAKKPAAAAATGKAEASEQPAETPAGAPASANTSGQHAPAAKASGGGWVTAVVILALVGLGGYLTYPKWKPLVASKLDKLDLPDLPRIKAEDPRVTGLSERITALEAKAGEELAAKDATIQELQKERERLSAELVEALARLETVEKSMASVRQIAEAAAQMDEASAAKESLQRLSARLSALEKAGGSAEDSTALAENLAAVRAAEARSRELADLLQKLERESGDAAASKQALVGVEKRLEEIERRAALVLAVGQLREAVQRGGGYAREVDTVKGLAAGDAGVEAALMPLAQHAKTGVPRLAQLRDDFSAMAGNVVARAGAGGDGWLDRLAARIGGLVRIRRTDATGSETVEGLVAQAEHRLQAGDLAGAVSALEGLGKLSADAAAAAASWLGRAKIRAAAERALAALHIHAVSQLDAARASKG